MKIAVFTDTFLPQVNGVTNTLRRLGDYMESQHMEYLFITPDQKNDDRIPYSVEKFFSTPFFLYPECRFSLPNMGRLHKKLETFRPDVIFLMTEFNMGLSGLLYGKKHGIPVISNYSTNFTTILKSYNLSFLEVALEKYLHWFHNEADFTVTPSIESEQKLKAMGIENTGIFGRGIDEVCFSPAKRNLVLRKKWES